jgi:hypothetical protein
MQILGYVGYTLLIFFAVTWTLGVRVKLGAGLFTIMGALFYMVAALLLGVFGINKLHSWWLLPLGFTFVMLCTIIVAHRVPLLYSIVKILGSVYAGIVRIGIPSDIIKAVQTADAKDTVERWASRQKGDNKNITPFDAALKCVLIYHKACLLGIANWEYTDKEKAHLATQLYFLGAVDCASQRHKLSDTQFGELIIAFFQTIGENEMYATFMAKFFLKMKSMPSAMKCVIEGGEAFNKWLNGNSMIPGCAMMRLEKFIDDPDFPASVGHLYAKIEKI